MNLNECLDAVAARTGLGRDEAARVLEASLRALGRGLRGSERAELAADWPPPLARALCAEPDDGRPASRSDLVGRLAALEGVGRGLALELASVVCGVLTEALPHDRLIFLRSRVADDLAALFVRRHQDDAELEPPPERPRVEPPTPPHTLADGRPGSRHPLSEGRATRAQPGSVAADGPDMHGGRRLSTARGTAQEQLHRTLAEGKPGSEHPLTDKRR